MALLEVLLRQLYLGKEAINRWHYEASGTPATVSYSFALSSAFGGIPAPVTSGFPAGSIMDGIATLQSTSVQYVELQVENLYEPVDFYTIPYAADQNGAADGTAMARYEAYAVQSNRVRTDIRRGNKRFVGMVEEAVGVGGAVGGTFASALAAIASRMSEVLEYDDEGNTLTFTPVVLSFDDYVTPRGNTAYKKYPSLALQLDHAAIGVSWTAKPNSTTQNSRKR